METIITNSYIKHEKGGEFKFTLKFKNKLGVISEFEVLIMEESDYNETLSLIRMMTSIEWAAKSYHTFKIDLGNGLTLSIPAREIYVIDTLESREVI